MASFSRMIRSLQCDRSIPITRQVRASRKGRVKGAHSRLREPALHEQPPRILGASKYPEIQNGLWFSRSFPSRRDEGEQQSNAIRIRITRRPRFTPVVPQVGRRRARPCPRSSRRPEERMSFELSRPAESLEPDRPGRSAPTIGSGSPRSAWASSASSIPRRRSKVPGVELVAIADLYEGRQGSRQGGLRRSHRRSRRLPRRSWPGPMSTPFSFAFPTTGTPGSRSTR